MKRYGEKTSQLVTQIRTWSGRVGQMTRLDAEIVWGIFEEQRPDGTTALGEECHLLSEVELIPPAQNS